MLPSRRPPLRASARGVLAFLLLIALGSRGAHAARTVRGLISDDSGAPVGGALVQVIDEDLGEDEFMAAGVTDADGRYAITYPGGHWDWAPHWNPVWRPDIYVEAMVPFCGSFRLAARSATREDHRLREDLTIDLSVPSVGTCRLERRAILPNRCIGECTCEGASVCTGSRSSAYLLLFEEPEACSCISIEAVGVSTTATPLVSASVVLVVLAGSLALLRWWRRRRKA